MIQRKIDELEALLARWSWTDPPRINGSHRVYTDRWGVSISFSPPHGANSDMWQEVTRDLRKRLDHALATRRGIIERKELEARKNAAPVEEIKTEGTGPALWYCKNCKQDKPVSEFQRAGHTLTGHLSVCRGCMWKLRREGLARKGYDNRGRPLKPAPEPTTIGEELAAAATLGPARDFFATQEVEEAPTPEPAPEPEPNQAQDLTIMGQLDMIAVADLFALAERDKLQLWVAGDYGVLWNGEAAFILTTHGEGPQQSLTPELAAYILQLLKAPREGKHYY